MTLEGRVVLVTGGARRIGRTIAVTLAQRRARLVLSYRTAAREAGTLVKAMQRAGSEVLAVRADVSNAADIVMAFIDDPGSYSSCTAELIYRSSEKS